MTGFAEHFSQLIKARGWNQTQASERLGISQADVSRYRSGSHEPGIARAAQIAERFGVPVDDLLGAPSGGMVREVRGGYGVGKEGTTIEGLQDDEAARAQLAGWMESLRTRYRRSPEDAEAVRVAVRTLFPPKQRPDILTWLATD